MDTEIYNRLVQNYYAFAATNAEDLTNLAIHMTKVTQANEMLGLIISLFTFTIAFVASIVLGKRSTDSGAFAAAVIPAIFSLAAIIGFAVAYFTPETPGSVLGMLRISAGGM